MIQPSNAVVPAAHLFPVSFQAPSENGSGPVSFAAWCMFVPRVGERVVGPDGSTWTVAEVAYAPHDTREESHFILKPTVRVQKP